MKNFSYDKQAVAAYVKDQLINSELDSQSITITIQATSEGYSVSTATAELSEDIELQRARFFSETQPNT